MRGTVADDQLSKETRREKVAPAAGGKLIEERPAILVRWGSATHEVSAARSSCRCLHHPASRAPIAAAVLSRALGEKLSATSELFLGGHRLGRHAGAVERFMEHWRSLVGRFHCEGHTRGVAGRA